MSHLMKLDILFDIIILPTLLKMIPFSIFAKFILYLPKRVFTVSTANWGIFGQLWGFFKVHVVQTKQPQWKLKKL